MSNYQITVSTLTLATATVKLVVESWFHNIMFLVLQKHMDPCQQKMVTSVGLQSLQQNMNALGKYTLRADISI